MNYTQKSKAFIRKAIRQRKELIKKGLSHKNALQITEAIQDLDRYLNAYPFTHPKNMAGFFLRHSYQIELLLPGEGSASHMSMISEFQELLEEAMKVQQQTPQHHANI